MAPHVYCQDPKDPEDPEDPEEPEDPKDPKDPIPDRNITEETGIPILHDNGPSKIIFKIKTSLTEPENPNPYLLI